MITSFISKYVDIEYFFLRIRVTMKWYGAYMPSDLIGQIQFTFLIYMSISVIMKNERCGITCVYLYISLQ